MLARYQPQGPIFAAGHGWQATLYRHGGGLDLGRVNVCQRPVTPPFPPLLQFFAITSVNAKQIEQPVFQAGPSRCESGHGCHCPQGVRERARLRAKQEARGASPRGGTILMVAMM